MVCIGILDSYLMGRSRTIGADKEMAGPPGGPGISALYKWHKGWTLNRTRRINIICVVQQGTCGRSSWGSTSSDGDAVRRLMGGRRVGLLHRQVPVVPRPVQTLGVGAAACEVFLQCINNEKKMLSKWNTLPLPCWRSSWGCPGFCRQWLASLRWRPSPAAQWLPPRCRTQHGGSQSGWGRLSEESCLEKIVVDKSSAISMMIL